MDKINKSQILKLFLLLALLLITPLLSSSLRTTYLYFVVNILTIALGVEAGLFSFSNNDTYSYSYENKTIATNKPLEPSFYYQKGDHQETIPIVPKIIKSNDEEEVEKVEKCSFDEKIIRVVHEDIDVKKNKSIEKCPSLSTPCLFFIGDDGFVEDDDEEEEEEVEEEEEEIRGFSGQELFNKAETFIGDFYKQLEMQRKESWKRLQDISTIKPFNLSQEFKYSR